MMKEFYLVTGSAGFIGFHLSKKLLSRGFKVIGIDALTNYYDKKLKLKRNSLLKNYDNYIFYETNLENKSELKKIFLKHTIKNVIHLAAQAGVRYSLENPEEYVSTNICGSFNLLEIVKELDVEHLLLASTSSIYGANTELPFREVHKTDHQISTYAATKKAMEILSHSYSYLYKIPTTVFRFFTVYGPWGRPDMALFKFTNNILKGIPIEVYNKGKMIRNFTYIDDLIESILKLMEYRPDNLKLVNFEDSISRVAPWRVVNIGGAEQTNLMDFINILEVELGVSAKKIYLDMQLGDVIETNSSNNLLEKITGYSPKTNIHQGIREFVKWYREYDGNNK